MEQWLENLINGWEFDRKQIVRHMGYFPKSLDEAWNSESAAPLLAWVAARTCRSQEEREAVLSAAIECARRTMQEIRAVQFDQDSTLESFEELAGYVTQGSQFGCSDLGGLLRCVGTVFEHVNTAHYLISKIREFVPLKSLPDNFNELTASHQKALRQKLSLGDFGGSHRKFPNQIALLVLNSEDLWLHCYYALNPDSPTTSFSIQEVLKRFLKYEADSESVRPLPPR